MKVAVFGATGGIGRLVVEQLLRDGHDVVAYVRNPAKLGLSDPRLAVVNGELSNAESVASACGGPTPSSARSARRSRAERPARPSRTGPGPSSRR
jgi:nucleoside-diphosphate-sugar epimerase